MPFKYDTLFQMTTAPSQLADANPHTAGWSEGHWRPNLISVTASAFGAMLVSRARLLPKQASIIGYRISEYEFVGNRMLPKGASAGRIRLPGNTGFETDVPQMALEIGASTGAANSTRFAIRCIPDNQIIGGEFSPSVAYKLHVSDYLAGLRINSWSMVGKDFSQPAYGIVSITSGGLLTLKPGAALTAEVDSVLLRGVRNLQGRAVSGAFQLGTSPAANQWNLLGWDQANTVGTVGTVRKDIIALFDLTEAFASRIVVRKVGAPFERYRGKASRRAAA